MKERRRCHRLRIKLSAWFKTHHYDESYSQVFTMDVSATGMSFITKEELELRRHLLVEVQLPNEKLTLHTQVVWVDGDFQTAVREYKVGLMLVEPLKYDEKKFVKYCAEQMIKHPELREETE